MHAPRSRSARWLLAGRAGRHSGFRDRARGGDRGQQGRLVLWQAGHGRTSLPFVSTAAAPRPGRAEPLPWLIGRCPESSMGRGATSRRASGDSWNRLRRSQWAGAGSAPMRTLTHVRNDAINADLATADGAEGRGFGSGRRARRAWSVSDPEPGGLLDLNPVRARCMISAFTHWLGVHED